MLLHRTLPYGSAPCGSDHVWYGALSRGTVRSCRVTRHSMARCDRTYSVWYCIRKKIVLSCYSLLELMASDNIPDHVLTRLGGASSPICCYLLNLKMLCSTVVKLCSGCIRCYLVSISFCIFILSFLFACVSVFGGSFFFISVVCAVFVFV